MAAVAHRFVVLRGIEGDEFPPVANDDEADFFSLQKFLDDEPRAKRANGGFRLGSIVSDDDALSGGEAVGFDHDRKIEFREGGEAVGSVFDADESCGGDAELVHKLLGMNFARFELREIARGADDGEAGGTELIHDTGGERGFGSDNGEIGCDASMAASSGSPLKTRPSLLDSGVSLRTAQMV